MRTIHYVSVFVVRQAGDDYELLLGLRAPGRYMGGTWQLITGGIEPGETAWQAAVREVKEETGCSAQELFRLSQVTQFYRADIDALCIAPMFCAMLAANADFAINSEHTHMEWTPLALAAERLMWPGDRTALGEVQSQILGNGPAKIHLRINIGAVCA